MGFILTNSSNPLKKEEVTLSSESSKEKDNISPSNFSNNQGGIQPINEPSELGEMARELNLDTVDDDKFSSIDMKTRLGDIEISSILAVDTLIANDFFPEEARVLTRSKKRLAISKDGKGREELVDITRNQREAKVGGSMLDKLTGAFKGG